MTTRTRNAVIVMQHVNWEDDGGSHNPFIRTLDDKTFEELQGYSDDVVPRDAWELLERLNALPEPTLPCNIDAIFNIWHNF
jgi:hypothetical protein